MKRKRILIVLLVSVLFLTAGFLFIPKIEAYDSETTHPLLTEKIAELYNAIYEPDLTQSEIQYLTKGSTDEDTSPRWINHFYDPTTGAGWLGKRLGGINQEKIMLASMFVFAKEPVSVVNWSRNQNLQNSEYPLYQGNRTFDSALSYYLDGNENEAYYSLGYALHLVEDMAVPAHTRQDTHFDMKNFELFEKIFKTKFDKGEPYENWAKQSTEVSDDIMEYLKNNYQPICDSLEDCLIFLANYSNKNFFSQDSILDEEYKLPVPSSYIYKDKYIYIYNKENILLSRAKIEDKTNILYEKTTNLSEINQSYWDNLSPAAVLAGVEVVKYFHEQAKKAKNNEITIEKPEKVAFWKKAATISPYGEIARLWKFASLVLTNPFSLWDDNSQQDEEEVKSQSPELLTDLGLTPEEAQERMDDIQELMDLLNNKEEGNNFTLPSLEPPEFKPPSLPPIELPSLELPELPSLELPPLEIPPLLQPLLQDQPQNLATTTNINSNGNSASYTTYPKILISEIQIAGVNDEKEEFVELYNPNDEDINLTRWYLQRKTESGDNYSTYAKQDLFSGKVIEANNYFLISRQDSSFAALGDIITDNSLGNSGSPSSLALKNPNREISDKLGFGQAQDYESSPAIGPEKAKSLGRKWVDGTEQDTDNNSADFEIQNPTPKLQNITPPVPTTTPESEPEPEPESVGPPTDTKAPTVIFNLSANQQNLIFDVVFNITDLSIENVSPSGLQAFQFRWKEEEGDWQEDVIQTITGTPATYLGNRNFTGNDEKTYYFQVKAKDVDDNESDWLPGIPASTRISTPKTILINEIQIDSIVGTGGTDDDWVELYNPYDIDVSLVGWSIQRSPESGTVHRKNFETGHKISAKGYFLIVRNNARQDLLDIADMTCSALQLSDNSTVYLVKNQEDIEDSDDADIVDKVGFGDKAFSFETNPAQNPPEGKSIERKRLGQDTNDNSADFKVSDEPTPKASSPKVLVEYIIDNSFPPSSNSPGAPRYSIKINWQSLSSDLDFYQVQYRLNDGDWQDWLLQTTKTEEYFQAVYSLFDDNIYYFRARGQDKEGNQGSWAQIKIDLINPVVINEFAFAGTNADSNDQWIELYNRSNEDIDLTGWKITSGPNWSETFNFELQGIIPSKGYFLLEKNDDNVISDITANQIFTGTIEKHHLFLRSESDRYIDQFYAPTNYGLDENSFILGDNHYSMERISPSSFGSDSKNWKLNNAVIMNGKDRNEVQIYGTPGSQNSLYQIYTSYSSSFIESATLKKEFSPYLFSGLFMTVFENATLTIEPGVVIKFYDPQSTLTINGALKLVGTESEKIIITSFKDDEYGGDSNNDGNLSQPIPGSWLGISFKKTSQNSELENVIIRYGGAFFGSSPLGFGYAMSVDQTTVSIKNSVFDNNKGTGLMLTNSLSIIDNVQFLDHNNTEMFPFLEPKAIYIKGNNPEIKNSYFKGNYYGIYITDWYDSEKSENIAARPLIENNNFIENTRPILFRAVSYPSFINNQASNNDFNAIIFAGPITEDMTLKPDLPYLIRGMGITVPENITLTIEPGVIMTFQDNWAGLKVDGTLKAIGTYDVPIAFKQYDDSELVMPGKWPGLIFTKTSVNSELENISVRYAGSYIGYNYCNSAGIKIDQATVSIKNAILEKNHNIGLWLINTPSIIDSIQVFDHQAVPFQDCGGEGIHIEGGSPTIKNSYIHNNVFGIYEEDWTDPEDLTSTPIPAMPILENNIVSDNGVNYFPPDVVLELQ
ncbi:lamin tail domain-containing protein [Patescibacteria group bacterium]|nr:lamin tail domain-containing protein [Patescibacteria group bacterium]